MFQSLIGKIKTRLAHSLLVYTSRFQSLIGKIKTENWCSLSLLRFCFNPS